MDLEPLCNSVRLSLQPFEVHLQWRWLDTALKVQQGARKLAVLRERFLPLPQRTKNAFARESYVERLQAALDAEVSTIDALEHTHFRAQSLKPHPC
jgi:hypothetical protein